MFQKISTFVLAGTLLIVGNVIPAQAAELPLYTAQRPVATNPARPALPQRPVGSVLPDTTVDYDAATMISTFATEELGMSVDVTHAIGVEGDVVIPPTLPATVPMTLPTEIDAIIALAGQVSVGTIGINGNRGAAEVAVGTGTISGDLEADITAASLGSYSLLLPQTPVPTDEAAAKQLLITLYPALSAATLQRVESEQGYLFKAVTTSQIIDPETMTLTTTAKAIITGVNGQEQGSAAWVVVGKGDFATALTDILDQLPSRP